MRSPLFISEFGRSILNRKTGEERKEIDSQGVSFVRRIDRIDFTGIGNAGGFLVKFGNNSEIETLEIIWRNLDPHKNYDMPSSEKIIRWLKEGKGVMTGAALPNLNWQEVKQLNISKLNLYYLGAGGEDRQSFVIPFADLEISAVLNATNISFHASCPIIDENN